MKRKRLPIVILSMLFAASALTGCNAEDFQNMKNDYQTQIDEIKEEIKEINTKITNLKTEMADSIKEVKDDYTAKINAANAEIATLQTELSTLEAKHDQELEALETDYNSKITALETSLSTNVSSLQTSINTQVDRITALQQKHDQEVAALRDEYEQKLAAQEATDVAARAALKAELDSNIAQLDEELEEVVTSLNQSIATNAAAIISLTNKHNEDVATVIADYTAKINAQEETDIAARNALKEEMNATIASLSEQFTSALALLQEGITANTAAIDALTNKHNADIEALTEDYNQKINALDDSNVEARNELKEQLETQISNLNETLTANILDLQSTIIDDINALDSFIAQYNTDKAAIEADYNSKMQALDAKYIEEATSIRTEINTLKSSVTSLTSEMNTQISNIQNDYISKINALTTRVADLEDVQYHTVTFVIEGRNPFHFESQIVKHGEKAIKPEFEEQAGYDFPVKNTFYANSGYGWEPWYFKGASVTEDIELHGYADALNYSIHLDENYPGGSTYYMADKVYSGESFICATPSARDGYVFEGWYKDNVQITDEQGHSLTPFNFAADVEFVAYWHDEGSSQKGTEDNPFTPQEARTYIEENAASSISTERIYVAGIISSKTEYNTDYENFNIYFQNDDGTDEEYLQVFRCKLDNDISYNDIQPGYYIVVEGYAKKYGATYELCPDANNTNNPTTVYFEYRAPVLQDIKLEDKVVQVGSNITLSVIPVPSYAPIADIDDAIWSTTSTNVEVSTYEGGVEGIYEGTAEVTVTIGSMSATCTVTVISSSQTVENVTYNVQTQGYENQQAVESWGLAEISITFDKGSNSNPPRYYGSGDALRVYGGNTITVTASEGLIKNVTFTFGSSDGSNEITVVKGTFTSPTWTGSETSVTFFIEGTSGNRRITKIAVSYLV